MYVNDLSFDPRHPWFVMPILDGVEWAIELFTKQDVWGLDPSATTFDGQVLQADRLQRLGGQRSGGGQVTVHMDTLGDLIGCRIEAHHADEITGAKLLIRGLPQALLDAGWWTSTTPVGVTSRARERAPVLLKYPWDSWQTPWACAGEGPGLVIGVQMSEVAPVRLYHYKPHWSRDDVVEIVCDAAATRRSPFFVAPTIQLRLAPTMNDIESDMRGHIERLESAFGLVDWELREDVPAWARNIDLVLTLHGQHWTGFVFNTFDRMAEILSEITTYIDGSHILAYLPGWEGRYYWQYPIYHPGEDLGGEAGFARLVETARRLGVHLMPMFGANGANVGRYPAWEEAALRSPTNRYVMPINHPDWNNDRAAEDDQVFLNPGEPKFRSHLVRQISALVDRFEVDAVLLDTSACWVNDGRYDLLDGFRTFIAELRERHPTLLICGEGWYDALLSLFPMNQTWRDVSHPVRFDRLPMRYSRALGHLRDGAPGAGSTGVHEGGTSPHGRPLRIPGYVPALSIVDDTLPKHADAVREFCEALAGART